MGFKCGIIGLPNVGKSTLFNALTKASIAVSNYPFCTIKPNVGMVLMPDKRMEKIAKLVQSKRTIPTTVKFVDVAGLVAGASKGQGLGNKFLANIRETQAIVHVVRCFKNENITHIFGNINPIFDIEVVNTELALADIETIDTALMKLVKDIKRADKKAHEMQISFEKFKNFLSKGIPLRSANLKEEEKILLQPYQLLTLKPVLYVANVSKGEFINDPYLDQVTKYTKKENVKVVPVCASMKAEIPEFFSTEQIEFLKSLGLEEVGLNRVIQASYELLRFITFFTAGSKEVRAWTCHKGTIAPQAARIIHNDIGKHFIRAEVISYDDYLQFNGEQGAKYAGKWRLEGKKYVVQDGDIVYFRSGTA